MESRIFVPADSPGEYSNTPIRRYISFVKFVSLLDRRAVFFSRASILEDRLEGSYTLRNRELRQEHYGEQFPGLVSTLAETHRHMPKWFLVSCWCRNVNESDALWVRYVPDGLGVAICSTCDSVAKSLAPEHRKHVMFGAVRYIDFERDVIPEGNLFNPYFFKRFEFEHEQELRAVLMELPEDDIAANVKKMPCDAGKYIPVDLTRLIHRIHVSPRCPEWFESLLRSVMRRFDLDVEVVQSSMRRQPVY